MKKLKLTMVSLAFVLFLSSTAFARQTNEPKPQSEPQTITYMVVVLPYSFTILCNNYTINIRDEMGNLVAEPLEYTEGKRSFIFHESGPVIGARIATMEIMDGPQKVCSFHTYIQPDQMFGHFNIGNTYQFYLYPITILGDDAKNNL